MQRCCCERVQGGGRKAGALTSENEEDKCMLLEEMIDQKEGLNCMITHHFLNFSFRNLTCSLNCTMQLVFLFVF